MRQVGHLPEVSLPEVTVIFVYNFSLLLFALTYVLFSTTCTIYSNWLQEQLCNLSLYTVYIPSVKQISLKKRKKKQDPKYTDKF